MEIHALTDGNDFVLSCIFLISQNNLLVHKDERHQAWNTDKKNPSSRTRTCFVAKWCQDRWQTGPSDLTNI